MILRIRKNKIKKGKGAAVVPGTRLNAVDHSRNKKIFNSLSKLSMKKRREQLKEEKQKKALKRIEAKPPTVPAIPGAKVTLNISGNRRGLSNHNDSEHMKKVRAMRKIYNKQMPVLVCDGCSFQSVCPQFRAGYECSFLPFLNSHKVEDEKDLIEYMKELLGVGMRRAHQAMLMETLSGASPSLENTESLNMLFNQFKDFLELMGEKQSLSIESEDSSIIGRLFGGLENLVSQTKEAQANQIQVDPVKLVEDRPTIDVELQGLTEGVNSDLIREHAKDELGAIINLKG